MELREFLNKVVGQGSITQNEEGQWSIKPYEIVTIKREGGYINGYITFKGERFQDFSGYEGTNTEQMVNTIVESLNHGYASAIKDVVLKGNIGESIKPFKFV